jgi:hypothetical protein
MATRPASIGDSKTPLKRIQEVFDLPDTRAGVVAKFERILESGGVQKIVIELGHPIRVERLVKASDAPDVEELRDDDWLNAVRNGELQEFDPAGVSPYVYLFRAFHLLSQKRLKARIILIHSTKELKEWMGLDSFIDVRELFGVEVLEHPDVPDQTAILISSNPDETDVPVFSLRLVFDKATGDKK